MRTTSDAKAHLAAILTIFTWGLTFVSTKILLVSFSPLEILITRFVLGFIFLCILNHKPLKTTNLKEEALFIFAGLCGVTLYFLLENIALQYSQASNIGIILATAPMFTAFIASRLKPKESLTKSFFIGFLFAITGIALVYFSGNVLLQLNPIGDLLAILAAIVFAIYSILVRKISSKYTNPIMTTRRIFFYGICFMLPLIPILGFNISLEALLAPLNLFNILFLGFGASAICFASWNYSVAILGAVKTSAYIYLAPVVTMVSSVLILGEIVNWPVILGAIFILVGLYLSERKQKTKLENKAL